MAIRNVVGVALAGITASAIIIIYLLATSPINSNIKGIKQVSASTTVDKIKPFVKNLHNFFSNQNENLDDSNHNNHNAEESEVAINPNFVYSLKGNVTLCSDKYKKVDFVLMIFTAVTNVGQRQKWRRNLAEQLQIVSNSCLAYKNISLRYQFIIGQLPDKKLLTLIVKEHEQFGDIIQGNFDDTYYNLGAKSKYLFNWICQYCQHAKYVIKIDDDVEFNVKPLFKYFGSNDLYKTDCLIGMINPGGEPIRDKQSKYYVSELEYPDTHYPAFAFGFGYLLPAASATKLLAAMMVVAPLRLDDVYVTGLARLQARLKPITTPYICKRQNIYNIIDCIVRH
jgi:hypothetical protein